MGFSLKIFFIAGHTPPLWRKSDTVACRLIANEDVETPCLLRQANIFRNLECRRKKVLVRGHVVDCRNVKKLRRAQL